MLLRARDAEVPGDRPPLLLLTGLPIVWGEGALEEVLTGARAPSASFRWLDARFAVETADALAPALLGRHRLLMLAQPRAMAPEELVALDAWVRAGGRVLILADPALRWKTAYPLGDRRAPPAVSLLDPLLDHWGITLDLEDLASAPAEDLRRLPGGEVLATTSPGMLSVSAPGCSVRAGGLIAECAIGRGRATVLADADLLADAHWNDPRGNNRAIVAGLLTGLGKSRDGDG